MTQAEIKTAQDIAHILKTQPTVAREIKNYFEKPTHLFNALGINAREINCGHHGSSMLVPSGDNGKTF